RRGGRRPLLRHVDGQPLARAATPAKPAWPFLVGVASDALELPAELVERGPARIGGELVVRVRLDVEVEPADRAEPRAVGTVQDLVRQRERKRVLRPARQLERVRDDVWRVELLVAARVRRLIFAALDRQ